MTAMADVADMATGRVRLSKSQSSKLPTVNVSNLI